MLWRPAAAVMADFEQIALSKAAGGLVAEWFDLHASKPESSRVTTVPSMEKELGMCMVGQLRGLCAPEHGVDQLYDRVLSKFSSFDVFVVVPTNDCALATRLFGEDPRVHAHVVCMDPYSTSAEEQRWLEIGLLQCIVMGALTPQELGSQQRIEERQNN